MKRSNLSPAEVAAQYGVGRGKVIAWVKSGELRGANLATKPNGRPRYRIDVVDLEAFMQRRQVRVHDPQLRRQRRNPPTDVTEFF
jgi:excisionase family DNA binding protein